MIASPSTRHDRSSIFIRYLGISLAASLVWETSQLPFYTIWSTGTPAQQVFSVLHCTVGDVMIAGLALLAALALFGHRDWPKRTCLSTSLS